MSATLQVIADAENFTDLAPASKGSGEKAYPHLQPVSKSSTLPDGFLKHQVAQLQSRVRELEKQLLRTQRKLNQKEVLLRNAAVREMELRTQMMEPGVF